MLQSIRDKTYGWPTLVLLFFVFVGFLFFGVQGYFSARGVDTVARVNGQAISRALFDAELSRMKQSNPSRAQSDLKMQALKELINQVLFESAMGQWHLMLNPQDVDQAILDIPQFQIDGHFSKERYLEVLSQNHLTAPQFKKMIRNQLLQEQFKAGVGHTEFALPGELKRQFGILEQTRSVKTLVLTDAVLKGETPQPTEEELNLAYQAKTAMFTEPAKAKVQYIQLHLNDIRSNIQISADQIKDYYKSHIEDFSLPVTYRLQHILIALPQHPTDEQKTAALKKAEGLIQILQTNPKNFAVLVKENSDDKPSLATGGELGWFTAPDLEPALQKAVTFLKKPGDLYPQPLLTSFGYHVLRLMELKPASARLLDTVKESIHALLLAEQANQAYQDLRQQLVDLTYQNPNDLKVAAETLHLTVLDSPWFEEKSGAGFSLAEKSPKWSEIAFSEGVLKEHRNSDLFEPAEGQAVVLRLSEHQERRVKPISEVKNYLIKILTQEKQNVRLKEWGDQLLSDWRAGKVDLEAWAKSHDVAGKPLLVETKSLTRLNHILPEPVLKKLFALPKSSAMQKEGIDGVFIKEESRYVLFQLMDVKEGDFSTAIENIQKQYREGFSEFLSSGVLDAFQNELYKNSQIEYDDINASAA